MQSVLRRDKFVIFDNIILLNVCIPESGSLKTQTLMLEIFLNMMLKTVVTLHPIQVRIMVIYMAKLTSLDIFGQILHQKFLKLQQQIYCIQEKVSQINQKMFLRLHNVSNFLYHSIL